TYTVNVAGGQNLFINLNSTTDETCAGANDGTITVSYGGGVGTYYLILLRQYSSDEFEEMQTLGPVSQPCDYTFTNVPVFLPGGFNQYLVRVVDGFSGIPSNYNFRCAGSVGNIFIYPNTPFNSGTAQITGPLLNCYGNNGQITITGTSGGTAPYEFSQDGEEFQSSNVFSGLGAQNSFYVRDSRGCKQGPINITIPSAPVTLNATATLTNSETACTKGSIQVNITGGTGPFEVALIQDGDCSAAYLFAAVTSSTSIPFTELSAGNYTVCIRDAGGCRADRSVAVPFVAEPNMVVTATQSTTCFGGGNNGAITLQASGGTPPYTITINNGSPQTGSNSFNFSSLAPGSYLFQLTDAKGCTDLLVGNVPSNNLLSASVDADAISGCAGGNTGVIRAIPYDGVAPYTVTWLWDNVTVSGVAEN
ncbi:MAG TPA: SprB repeat-containing protein, partial [Saprospiraceae bacterium]|nr:SprB repeat-containing protein [Saprospiraceae bacterium]